MSETETAAPKKRSGVSGDRAYRIQRTLLARMSDAFESLIAYKGTHEDLNERIITRIRQSPEWAKAPARVHSYLEGYAEARRNELYRYHITWMHWFDGRLLTREQVDAENEARGTANTEQSLWRLIDSDKSRHVWRGHPDKSYDRKWR